MLAKPVRTLLRSLLLAALAAACLPAAADRLVGDAYTYTVQRGDYLIRIGARIGQDPRLIARENDIAWDAIIHPGQRLRLDNRHIVPERLEAGVLINIPQRMLFVFSEGRLAAHYPVGLGRPDWATPVGPRTVRSKEVDKTWFVPPSIQEAMRRAGRPVLTRVPPGPDNPLGRHWIGLAPGTWGIHGTNAPPSVYHFQSHGCIRLHPDDAADLFDRVELGDPVEIVYRRVLLARRADGTVWLEVHPDIYHRGDEPWQELLREAQREGVLGELDWSRVGQVMEREEGIARPVHLRQVDR